MEIKDRLVRNVSVTFSTAAENETLIDAVKHLTQLELVLEMWVLKREVKVVKALLQGQWEVWEAKVWNSGGGNKWKRKIIAAIQKYGRLWNERRFIAIGGMIKIAFKLAAHIFEVTAGREAQYNSIIQGFLEKASAAKIYDKKWICDTMDELVSAAVIV